MDFGIEQAIGNQYNVNGTYGGFQTPCVVYVFSENTSLGEAFWYAVEGSLNVNCTLEPIEEEVDVETIEDHETFTASKPILSESQLREEVEEV